MPEQCYVKLDEDAIDDTVNKYELTNEDGTYTYMYIRDLLALEEKRPSIPPLLPLLGRSITSPLVVHNWNSALENHPDWKFVRYIVQGLTHGFHIGFDRQVDCRSAKNNEISFREPIPSGRIFSRRIAGGENCGPARSQPTTASTS